MVDVQSTELELRPLMIASLGGDADAHRVLLTQLSRRLRAYFRARLARVNRGPVEAEDLVQEALMAIHTRRHTYDVSRPFTPWMYAIARYKFLDYLRRTKASMQDISIEETEEAMAQNDADGVESSVDLEKLLARVSPKMRRAIQDVKLDGLSVREAAARSGMSESAVKVSIHRGLRAVAELIRRESSR
ncbi:MAG: sigma-70 family RNA polymerase sigma factor [Vicinamibacteraceae bacterium]